MRRHAAKGLFFTEYLKKKARLKSHLLEFGEWVRLQSRQNSPHLTESGG